MVENRTGIVWAQRHHLSGNFWWTKGVYFLSLPAKIGPEYTAAEQYILMNNDVKIAQVWATGMAGGAMYWSKYPPSNYVERQGIELVPFNVTPGEPSREMRKRFLWW